MRTKLWPILSVVTLLAMLISPIGASNSVLAEPVKNQSDSQKSNMQVIEGSYVGLSQPLRSLTPVRAESKTPDTLGQLRERLIIPKTGNALSAGGFDPSIVQNRPVSNSMPVPVTNLEGVPNRNGVYPPDTEGDIGWDPVSGTKYYVQWVNLSFQIWDVTDPAAPVSLYGPTAGNTLWAGTGTICESNNDGDPITQFDHLANRWLMSQFALGFPNNFHQCIAISATADPTGAWYRYDFKTSASLMNDYPKFGVWSDGYYMTVNQFNGVTENWEGAGVAVFERDAMLQGLAARMFYFDIGAVTLNYGGMLPSDLDGPAPAVGTPNYFMEWDDSTWLGDPTDTLRIWKFHVDWAVPANTTFGRNASYDPSVMITTANVDPSMCSTIPLCVDQPDTTQGLDAISDRLMYRLQYRDFGTYQTLVGNHTVDADGSEHAGIHWFELRDTGSGFAMYQQGVYAGDVPNTDSRWMGSIASDRAGNMALGYSVSGAATYPSVRYTGRLATDPPSGLTQGETSVIAGSGSQTGDAGRWGDYSTMSVDPADGCTFWYTQEYIQTTGGASWQTRISSFKFPSCTTAPTGTLSGTVTDGTDPIEGATIDVSGGYTTTTDDVGHYELLLVDDTYDVTASRYGYFSSTVNGVVVTSPGTTTQDFTLAAAPTFTISGVVTDVDAGWPLYVSIDISGYPLGLVYTDPVTGAYSVDLTSGSYTFTVSAMSGGYHDAAAPVVVAGDATKDFTLTVDQYPCSAPGYTISPPVFSESFETWPLAGWTIVDNESTDVYWDSNTNWGDSNLTGGSGLSATVDSDAAPYIEFDTELITPVITTASLPSYILAYLANYQNFAYSDFLDLDINVDGGGWTNVLSWNEDHGTEGAPLGEAVEVDLTSLITGSTNFRLRWHYYDPNLYDYDWYAQIDDVMIGPGCVLSPTTGLIVGAVKDANTSNTIVNARVEDSAFNQALFIDNSADTSEVSPLYIIAEPAGAVSLTASARFYADNTQSPVVVAWDVIRQDFDLAAGILSVDPASMTFSTSPLEPTDTQPATIANLGSLGADYEIFAIPGEYAGFTPIGPFAENTRHTGPPHLNDRDASKLRVPYTLPAVPLLPDAGTVSTSWPTTLTYAWGIGFNTDATDLWLSDIGVGGGDDLDYRFTTAGVNTWETIDTSKWGGAWAADMTYNPFTNMLWQVNVGGDNCIYEIDPASLLSTGNKICPLFGTSERGLAFDPLTYTYYAGSWNDGIINHFAPDGTLLAAVDVGLPISGLAFNPTTGHLFVVVNDSSLFADIYVLDTNTPGYDNLGSFLIMDGGTYAFPSAGQAGLEIDCDGNLWAVNQNTQMVYAADSGETGVCDWQVPWLSSMPVSGSIAIAGSSPVAVNVDSTGMPFGTYKAYLRIVSNTPYGDKILPVTLQYFGSILFLPMMIKK